ncbi:MAG TPA: glycoside hydrolase family 2 TIM barrel-domain containing protein [Anaerolineales bacterium]|nr:glycoside hydrolase family 2 TIM barrel-domain containing protein [Anaerolineales bacterium]
MITHLHDLSGPWHYLLDDRPANAHPKLNTGLLPTMQIPQNWFLAGLDHHGVVWFRRQFQLRMVNGQWAIANGEESNNHQQLTINNQQFFSLHFDGVDYFADVFLNGKRLGRHEGYFDPFSFDVTGLLQEGDNVLAVRVDSPYEEPGLDGWHMKKRLIKGVLNHHDCRPGGGWLPIGQSYNTGGIWNRVYILEHGPITIESVHLRAGLEQDPPVLHAEVTIQNRGKALSVETTLHAAPENFASDTQYAISNMVEIPAGISVYSLHLPVPSVAFWNPWDRGFPHLYRAQLTINHQQIPISHYETSFGFRTIQVDSQFNWTINDSHYFPRASNYIASQWLSETLFPEVEQSDTHPFRQHHSERQRISKSTNQQLAISNNLISTWFEHDLTLARNANLNLLRIHAHVLPTEFYEAADRAGILVWQDFPFQWGYQDTPEFHSEAERQIKAMAQLLYNHPSIAAWCIHNESPWDAEWMAQEAGGTYDPTHNRALDEKLEKVVKSLDSTRYVHQNSGVGDGHVYPGWYYGDWIEYANLPGAPFPTEYGAQALPNKDSLFNMFPEYPDAGHTDLVTFKKWQDDRKSRGNKTLIRIGGQLYAMSMTNPSLKWLKSLLIRLSEGMDRTVYHHTPSAEDTPSHLHPQRETWLKWRFHDFQPGETFTGGRVTLGQTLDDFIASSQSYQAWIVQYATEAYRRHKTSMVKGIFHFMLTDPWPAITWAVVDYARQPKPGYDALRRAMQPVLPTADVVREYKAGQPIQFNFYVVNDLTTPDV